ncbi:vitamin B12 dependent-methionine synthase activation domain-containing protein [Brachyspira hyodysenteriae]|uniref:5-methyltetrahydrofolate--homocysteine methyltransferase n=1 Tax=Brachyspira hyodysenteriae (strain ATCC 49526 / WA1) TaxID=565034 RepID=A0A3B6VC47_BRAHW|nr:vitamin B12 dependent-methionine synthase activation domain-containing protein [Brachyspira hyodysenteriae]ACN82961.1 5-methyltetrahydrofolate--homocysteine methyltransferase [Brachyspira hyodysenteriae WA1]KLI37902.1 5-methyltetrahydrofolate--homocysteine methyltransferase [Brachyspira hyodysenteriae]KLI44055.1 5-methyltetrahydrofolate--homocysteine methyltransferase [Brachyspira hyodysenteriae]KLI56100.1 5-methyltetrahydrofolate--homocysteine methyltransferase [Brachyspira hyodysenteriae]
MPEINHKNHEHYINKPPFYGRKVFEFNKQIEKEAFDMINKVRLFRAGFGYSAKNQDMEKYNEMIKSKVEPKYEEMKSNIIENNLLEPVMLYGFYKTITENDKLYIYDIDYNTNELKNEKIEIPLERMEQEPYNSIVDFFDKEEDTIGFTLVSLGEKFHKFLKGLYDNDDYKDYYFYNAIGTNIIENYVDILQSYMESLLNLNNNGKRKHVGCRYSFGYKALANMYGNRIIFDKLKPEEFNVILTESYMMDPELSTCAIISFCEDSYYFAN